MGDDVGKGRISPVDEVQLLRAAACDWRLSRGDVGVFAVILEHCDAEGMAFPGPTRIAQRARLALNNAKLSIRALEQLGYVEVIRPGRRKANRYRILDAPFVPAREAREAARELRSAITTSHARVASSKGRKAAPASATSHARMAATSHAGVQKLATRAWPEGSYEIALESAGAARPLPSEETTEQKRRRGEREICLNYQEALRTDPRLASMMRSNYHQLLTREGLIPEPQPESESESETP